MKKIVTVFLVIFAILFSSCASYSGNLMAKIKQKPVSVGETTADSTAFALNLLKSTYNGENTVISPASAYLALSMVANGATGDTLKEFENVLGAPLDELNGTSKVLLDALNKSYGGLTLRMVDGIWYNTEYGFKPNPVFLQTNADYFGATELASDFSKPETLNAINQFVNDNTNGMISTIMNNLEEDAIMVLVNTLYFKGKWESPFNAENTVDQDFTTVTGKKVSTRTMVQKYDSILYFDDGDARGIILPYHDSLRNYDSRFSYVTIMPSGSVSDYLASLTVERFKSLIKSASDTKVELTIPKYKVTGDFKLVDTLEQMGLQLAFDKYKADFSTLGTAGRNTIYIDNVLQKVVFRLDEDGTEAAATTSVMVAPSAPLQQDKTIELRLDHPFIYALMDMRTDTPLFMGVLDNPAAAE